MCTLTSILPVMNNMDGIVYYCLVVLSYHARFRVLHIVNALNLLFLLLFYLLIQ